MIDQAKVRVLLLESIHADAVARLEAEGYQVESVRTALDEAELIERMDGVHLVGIRYVRAFQRAQADAMLPWLRERFAADPARRAVA